VLNKDETDIYQIMYVHFLLQNFYTAMVQTAKSRKSGGICKRCLRAAQKKSLTTEQRLSSQCTPLLI